MDQAETLRKLMQNRTLVHTQRIRPIRTISITSGKGGVGKTNITANLAVLLQKAGYEVLVLDGDFGLANMNIVMGLETKYNIYDVISGTKEISDVILKTSHGVRLIPASSGIFQMTQLSMFDKATLMEKLELSNLSFDILLIDTGAGIHSDVTYLNAAATEVIVIATPEPTSMADAYALMKVMSQQHYVKEFNLIVNMTESPKEALSVYKHLLSVSDQYLNINIKYLGFIFKDPMMSQAVNTKRVLCDDWPECLAVKNLKEISQNLLSNPMKSEFTGSVQFFWRTLLSEVKS